MNYNGKGGLFLYNPPVINKTSYVPKSPQIVFDRADELRKFDVEEPTVRPFVSPPEVPSFDSNVVAQPLNSRAVQGSQNQANDDFNSKESTDVIPGRKKKSWLSWFFGK